MFLTHVSTLEGPHTVLFSNTVGGKEWERVEAQDGGSFSGTGFDDLLSVRIPSLNEM